MGGLCSGPKDPEALSLEEVIHNTCTNKTCDGWIERDTTLETDWQYVGQGKGSFEQVRSFDYVGDGQGSYAKDARTQYHGWRLGTYGSLCAATAGLVFFAVLLTKLVLPAASREAQEASAAASGQEAAETRHSLGRAPPARAEPFNCSSYYFNQPWTQSKALWCCAERGVGCTTSAPPGIPGTSWMLMPVPMAPAGARGARAAAPAGAGAPAGTAAKAAAPAGAAAAPAGAAAAPAGAAAASAGAAAGLRPAAAHPAAPSGPRLPMPHVTFDCASDFGHWRFGWSTRKKEWCCERENKGCPFNCKEDTEHLASWPAEKRAWCCRQGAKWCALAGGQAAVSGAG